MAYTVKPAGRDRAQDRSVKKLQDRLDTMQRQMVEQALLRQKLEELTDKESARTQKALDKVSASNMLLKDEIDRVYGPERSNLSPTSNKVLEDLLARRTKEFEASQAKKAANIEYLTKERQRILEARNRLRERNDVFRSLPSPIGSDVSEILMRTPSAHTPGYRSVHSPASNVQRAVNDIPDAVDRIWNLRESLHHDYVTKRKPYAGELGIDSYLPWQIPDFLMVRKLMEDFVDDFIIKHIPPDHAIFERDMKLELLDKTDKDWSKTSKALSERKAVLLVSEEILLEVTSKLVTEIASEGIHQDVMFKRMSGNMYIKEAEVQATGNPDGRDPNDPAYDLITRTFHTLQKNRDHHKKKVWVHSQPLNLPAVPPPVALQRHAVPDAPEPPKSKAKPEKKTDKKVPDKVDAKTRRK